MTYLTDAQKYTLEHALSVAAERFDHDAQTFLEYAAHTDKVAAAADAPTDRVDSYRRIVEQFTKQAREARDLYALISDADHVRLAARPPDPEQMAENERAAIEAVKRARAEQRPRGISARYPPPYIRAAGPLNLVDQFGDPPITRALLDTDLFSAGTLRADADGTVYRALPARHASKQRWRRITNVGGTVLLAGAEKYARIVDTRRSAAERYFSPDQDADADAASAAIDRAENIGGDR